MRDGLLLVIKRLYGKFGSFAESEHNIDAIWHDNREGKEDLKLYPEVELDNLLVASIVWNEVFVGQEGKYTELLHENEEGKDDTENWSDISCQFHVLPYL